MLVPMVACLSESLPIWPFSFSSRTGQFANGGGLSALNLLILLFVFFPTLLVVGVVVFVTVANYARTRNGSYPPLVSPITKFGNYRLLTFLEFSTSPLKTITRLKNDYGPVFTMSMFGQNLTVLVGPEPTEVFFKVRPVAVCQRAVCSVSASLSPFFFLFFF